MARAVADSAISLDEKVQVKVRSVGDDEAARAGLLDGTADAWLHQGRGGWVLTTRSDPRSSLRAVVAEVVRAEVLRANATALGTTADALQRGAGLQTTFLEGDADRADLVTGAAFAFAFLFYLAALLFGVTLANSVLEEKQSRVVEIIATAIPVRHLLAGKVLGNTVLALGQLTLYLVVGLVGLTFTRYSRLVPMVSGPVVWFVVFFLAGFIAMACLWAVAGALASRTEDLQSTMTPLTLILVGVLFGGLSLHDVWRTVGSFVPPLSAVLMPVRLLDHDAVWWEALLALGILIATAALTVKVGERLYRRSCCRLAGVSAGGRLGGLVSERAEADLSTVGE